jgi:hypothetical protein
VKLGSDLLDGAFQIVQRAGLGRRLLATRHGTA